MSSFTLAGKTPFGASHDTIDVEVSEDVVVLVHHGTIEASLKKRPQRLSSIVVLHLTSLHHTVDAEGNDAS